jgi:hypothetical protein
MSGCSEDIYGERAAEVKARLASGAETSLQMGEGRSPSGCDKLPIIDVLEAQEKETGCEEDYHCGKE